MLQISEVNAKCDLTFSEKMQSLRRQRKTICLPRLDAASARSIGEIAINLALRRGQAISICIANRSRTLYLCALDGSECVDESDLQKCMQTAQRFEQSSLEVGLRLRRSKRALSDFGFDRESFSPKGGAIPLFVERQGLAGAAAIGGLSDEANHDLIFEAACWHLGISFDPMSENAQRRKNGKSAGSVSISLKAANSQERL